MAHIRLENVNKVYENGFHAVHDFNMEIERGEFIVLVGPSGCGKSTTLRMIAGLEEISGGTLTIGGQVANQKSPRDRGVAMVFQSYALYPNMTVYENLAFGLTLKGINEDVIEQRVHRIAKILGLTPYLDRMPRELSGGQCQRVAVGRAIIRRVEVFLMDEPLSNLDAKQRVTMRSEIIQIHRKVGATTIYVTHDQTEAMTMADRIVVMKEGIVQQMGTPKELYFTPVNKFVAGFIGEPPMNFVDCVVIGGKAAAVGVVVPLKKGINNNTITVGFRPEAVRLTPVEGGSFHGVVELTEMLGDYSNMYIDLDGSKIIIRVSPYDVKPVGEKIDFYVPQELLYFFDSETEQVL